MNIMACVCAMISVLSLVPLHARAEDLAEFYKGKMVTIVVGHAVGTGFDIYSRVLARHMGRHMPGRPSFLVQNMAGASGVTAANWVFNIAPKDGTVMGTFAPTVALEPMFGNTQARYVPNQFIWIGNLEASVAICGVSRFANVRSLADLMQTEIVMGAAGPTGPPTITALALKNVLGAKIRLITGYKGAGEVKLALKRGEVQGICGLPWSTLSATWREELESGEFLPILQVSGGALPGKWKVQHYIDLVMSNEQKEILSLLFGIQGLGRPYVMPPGVSPEKSAVISRAFIEVTRDPEFIADAKQANIDIIPMDGETVRNMWREYAAIPASTIATAKKAITP